MASTQLYMPGERPTQAPKPPKAYKSEDFLNGPQAQLLRIQCEFEEPRVRLAEQGIEHVIMMFGSARSKSPAAYEKALEDLTEKVKTNPALQPQLTRLQRMRFLCRYHDETIKLAKLITEFSESRRDSGLPTYTVGTGGGPGMMEAANEGAWRAGGESAGFGITLPFEDGLNPFVTPECGFEFHYFFTRKFWMAYMCMGLVVAPGGYGTCDELFEILALLQTGKLKRNPPVILFGQEYWGDVIQLDHMVEHGLISHKCRGLVYSCDTAEDAFAHLKKYWLEFEASGKHYGANGMNGASPMQPPAKKARITRSPEDPLPTVRPLPTKAYKNMGFIKSAHSRLFRIQCEYEDTKRRLIDANIQNTLIFIGSGRVKSYQDHVNALTEAARNPESKAREMQQLMKLQPFLSFHQVSRDLARRITAWSLSRRQGGEASYHVATGGGPGFMEAANEGAWEAGGKSLAFSIDSQPKAFNKYVTPELAFVFHYFFTRKFWMSYNCQGVVAFPGGFGVCDELFEMLTLIQTGKIKRKMPIVLIGVDYWKSAIHWRKMADYGMISDDDVDQLFFTDSAEDAFEHITNYWTKQEESAKAT